MADAPHILNVSGNNTLNVLGDWNTGTFVPFGTTADSPAVTQHAGNWNIQSDSGLLTIAGGNIYNTGNVASTLQLLGEGNGQIDAPLRQLQSNPNLNIFKNGAGTWTLTNIPSTDADLNTKQWQGNTTVSGGTLRLAPTIANGSMVLSGSVAVASAGNLRVSSFNASDTVVTTSALNLATGGVSVLIWQAIQPPLLWL